MVSSFRDGTGLEFDAGSISLKDMAQFGMV